MKEELDLAIVWTLENGIDFIKSISHEAYNNGLHLALCGGVLENGYSYHDLDICVFPLTPSKSIPPLNVKTFQNYLKARDITNFKRNVYTEDNLDFPGTKIVLSSWYQCKQIDWFFFDIEHSQLEYETNKV
jgi:hypothetical protein